MIKGTKLYTIYNKSHNNLFSLKWLKYSFFIFSIFSFQSIHAADLMDVYGQALESDPEYKAAYTTFLASAESIEQARAALRPQLLATAVVSRNNINVLAGPLSLDQTYNSHLWELSASQTIFNFKAWANLQQAKASVKAALATYNDACQNLMIRTASQYFKVLFTQDTLNFAEAKLRANKRQLQQATKRFEVGLDPITSVYEAQAAHDQSVAEVIAAKNNQINENENLRKLTNRTYEHIAALRDSKIPLIKPEPVDPQAWISAGIKQNYNLLSAKYNLQASREQLRSQAAGNWPVFSIQAAKSQLFNSDTVSNFFVPSHENLATMGVAVNFPFYQGGLVQAQTRQAQFNFQTTSAKLEQAYRQVIVNGQIAFNSIIDGISKVMADRRTVLSRQKTVESTEAQYRAGTRTMVDVVNAQQRLFESQQLLASDQYAFINAILNLKYLAGTLCVRDLEEVNAWLNTILISDLSPPEKFLAMK